MSPQFLKHGSHQMHLWAFSHHCRFYHLRWQMVPITFYIFKQSCASVILTHLPISQRQLTDDWWPASGWLSSVAHIGTGEDFVSDGSMGHHISLLTQVSCQEVFFEKRGTQENSKTHQLGSITFSNLGLAVCGDLCSSHSKRRADICAMDHSAVEQSDLSTLSQDNILNKHTWQNTQNYKGHQSYWNTVGECQKEANMLYHI